MAVWSSMIQSNCVQLCKSSTCGNHQVNCGSSKSLICKKRNRISACMTQTCDSVSIRWNSNFDPVVRSSFFSEESDYVGELASKVIKDCARDGDFEDAIRVYIELLDDGFPAADFEMFPILVKAFGSFCDVRKGREVHGHLVKLGALGDIYVANSILGMYWKCRAGDDAVKVFERMRHWDGVSWNSMISGLNQAGEYVESLKFVSWMMWESGLQPSRVACLSALSACASIEVLRAGKEIHAYAMKCGFDVDEFVVSVLIEMYMKCGDVRHAVHVFRNQEEVLTGGNVVLWNVMLFGYISNGCLSLAVDLFNEMLRMDLKHNASSMLAGLVLCSEMLNLHFGKQIHDMILRNGLDDDVRVKTALMDMYFKCGDGEGGLKIFNNFNDRNLIMWGAAISNCVQSGFTITALELFCEFLLQLRAPDSAMLLSVLRACSSLAHSAMGMGIHGFLLKKGVRQDAFLGSALVDFYAKCKDMESSKIVFDSLIYKDIVVWNALISGYVQSGWSDEALKAFRDMLSEQLKPNTVTASSILSASADLAVKITCKEIHGYLTRRGLESRTLVMNSLIAAYSKCGDINSSLKIFDRVTERSIVSWNSIIFSLGMHNKIDDVVQLFGNMIATGMEPDKVTFTAILSACSHAGRVEEGWKYFASMSEDHKIERQVEHYTCMVDLLGRAGQLKRAYDLILSMPFAPDAQIWGSLLAACRTRGGVKLARTVADHIFKIDPSAIGYHVLLANLYEDAGDATQVNKIRTDIKDLGLKKNPGCSWIEVNNNVHTFIASDLSHHETDQIYSTVRCLTSEIIRAGYNPQNRVVRESTSSVF